MIATAKFEMDRPYFEAMFREAVRNSNWLKRWQLPVSMVSIVLGLLVLAQTGKFVVVGALLVAIGVIELSQFVWNRAFWVHNRLKARNHLKSHSVELRFFEDGFTQTGPTASGRVSWEGVHKVRETQNALHLSLGDGMSIYIPKTSINPVGAGAEIVRVSKR